MKHLFQLTLIFLLSGYAFGDTDTNALKANYIYYFAKLISWNHSEAPKAGTIAICYQSSNSDIAVHFQSLAGKKIGGRQLITERIGSDTPSPEHCHVVYQEHSTPILSHPYQLVVTNQDNNFGDITFVTHNSRLGFEIKQNQLQEKKLKASSRLLRLAAKVTR